MSQVLQPEVGDELPPFVRVTGLDNWNRFAAVNDEFVPIHMDDEAGRAAGYPSAFGMGTLQWSYLHNVVRGWCGPSGRILSLRCEFRSANTKGMTVTARGVVTNIRSTQQGRIVDLDVWTEDQEGRKIAPGSASVLLLA